MNVIKLAGGGYYLVSHPTKKFYYAGKWQIPLY